MFRPWENLVSAEMDVVYISDSDSDPDVCSQEPKSKKSRNQLSSDAKQLVRNCYEGLVSRGCEHPLKETSFLMKVAYNTVRNILQRDSVDRKKVDALRFKKLSVTMGTEIKTVIYGMYKDNIVPTTSTLMVKLKEKGFDIDYSEETFRCYLRSIGFKYNTLDRRISIMETPRLRKMRSEYITKIQKHRAEGRHIVYLDETWYDTHEVVKKGITDGSKYCCLNTPPSRGKRIIILHAGSQDGWTENGLLLSSRNIADSSADYHSDMDASLFETWFQNQLLPNLPPNSVIVMDNARYHSRQRNKKPSTKTKRADIIQYMQSKNIEVPKGATRKKMLDILRNMDILEEYEVDHLAEKHGHSVLRLPPYYCVLNPIELVWSNLKRSVRRHNQRPTLSQGVVQLIRDEVDNIQDDLWRNCVRHAIDVENSYIVNVPELIISLSPSDDEYPPGCDTSSDDSDN